MSMKTLFPIALAAALAAGYAGAESPAPATPTATTPVQAPVPPELPAPAAAPAAPAKPGPVISINGGASMSLGYIEATHGPETFHYHHNRMQSVGGQLLLKARMDEHFLVETGLGILERHYLAGRISDNSGRTPFLWSPYVVNADFNYAWSFTETIKLGITGGYFPYSYNPDVKNLGLYLIRGPVYPGILISGFENKYARPVANTLGLRIQNVFGNFEENLILNSETETYPLFDGSLAYIAGYKFGQALRIGGGVNFTHLIPVEGKLTHPDTLAYDNSDAPSSFNGDPNTRTWTYVDTVAHDTTFLSFAGTKVMANACFDPKAFFDSDIMGAEDLRLYGEVAVIGLDMSAAYKAVYGGYKRRMPVMVGFNLPVFKFLDHLSMEVEWYGARFKDDLARYQSTTANYMSPLPVVNANGENLGRDDWKWSLHAQKTWNQFRFSGQVANDHSRPGGTITAPGSEWRAYSSRPTDFYWVLKTGFFF